MTHDQDLFSIVVYSRSDSRKQLKAMAIFVLNCPKTADKECTMERNPLEVKVLDLVEQKLGHISIHKYKLRKAELQNNTLACSWIQHSRRFARDVSI